jgi:hypothetical protein
MNWSTLIRRPSAYIPVAMSLAALSTVIIYGAIFGTAQEANGDEGAAARFYQLLMAGQMPIVGVFAIKWLPRVPKPTLFILALQACAWLAAFLPIYILERR